MLIGEIFIQTPFKSNLLFRIHQIQFIFRSHIKRKIGIDTDRSISILSAFKGHDNHSVGSFGSVNGSGCSIFQYGYALDIFR